MPHNPPLILYVEDDGLLLNMYEQLFTIHGYGFAGAADFQTGRTLIPEKMPDIVLLDLLLPDLASKRAHNVDHVLGMQILKEMKENPKTRDIPAIILSNVDEPRILKQAKELGAEDFLVKANVLPHDTLNKVKAILTGRGIPIPEKRRPG